MNKRLALTSAIILFFGCSLWAQGGGGAQGQPAASTAQAAPLTEKDVIAGLKKKPELLVSAISERGVDFDLTPEIEKQLRKAKADDTLLDIIRKAGPTARAKAAQTGGAANQPRISPEEYQAFQPLRNELDPDKTLQMVADFEKKFPNSALLTYAYMFGANAYQQKNDVENAVKFAQRSIKLKGDYLPSLIMLSAMIPQPQFLKDHEPDREKYLDQAEDFANRALKLIAEPTVIPRQPNESDDAYAKRKDMVASDAHASLGMVHLERSQLALQGPDKDELEKAEKEYQQAISLNQRPNPQDYFRLGEALGLEGKLDEAIDAFTKAGQLGQGSLIQTYADQRIADLKKRKAQGGAPAKP